MQPIRTIGLAAAAELSLRDRRFAGLLAQGGWRYVHGAFCRDEPAAVTPGGRLRAAVRLDPESWCLSFCRRRPQMTHAWGPACSSREARPRLELYRVPRTTAVIRKAALVSAREKDLPAAFGRTLETHLEERGLTRAKLCALIGMDEKTLRAVLSADNPPLTKRAVVAMAVALKLEPPLSRDLLRKAGLVFTPTLEDALLQLMADNARDLTLEECSETLAMSGLKPLARRKARRKERSGGESVKEG